MMYRLQVVTDDDQYEMWAHDKAEAAKRFQEEIGKPSIVFLYGSVPTWLTISIWSQLRSLVADDRIATKLSWALDALTDAA